MALRYASRLDQIRSFQVMDLLDRARALEAEGRDVVHMEVGEPDFGAAPSVLAAAGAAIEAGRSRYTSALGLPELREGIAAYYLRFHGVRVPPERIVVTAGASAALVMLAALLIEPGDDVVMTDPGYPCNRHFPRLVGGRPRPVPVTAEDGYQLHARHLDRHWLPNCRGVLLASPANPTGSVLGRTALGSLLDAVARRGGWTIVDEIYQGLTYPAELEPLPSAAGHGALTADRVGSVLELVDDADAPVFVVNSFSKYFGMTGFRVGWIVAPESAVAPLEKLAQNFYIAPSTVGQHAAVAALQDAALDVHEERRRAFCERRNVLVAGLRGLGFEVPRVPEGAFYVYAGLPEGRSGSFAFCARLLDEFGVAATPGTDFGSFEADRHVRFAYTAEVPRIAEALERIEAALGAPG